MLLFLVSYFNSRGIYFDDNNNYYNYNSDSNFYNAYAYGYNNNSSYQQANVYQPSRRHKRRGNRGHKQKNNLNKTSSIIDSDIPQKQSEKEKSSESKIAKDNRGYELLVRLGCEDGNGLGKNAGGITEPPVVLKKDDRKGLATAEETKRLSKNRRERLRRKLRKEAELSAKKVAQKSAFYSNNTNIEELPENNQDFLYDVARGYRFDIKKMQKRLLGSTTTCNSNDSSSDMIVARISIDNNQTIEKHLLEFIRTDLVGWIGAYQKENRDTPIFHSITNNSSNITIVCDNDYAYNCLEQCVNDITEMKTMGALSLSRLPEVSPTIYCFDAVFEGLARDPDLFLTQLHLHKSKLNANNWVVISHVVCLEECKTYFTFLVDECSALALTFHYRHAFCICLQIVTFRSRGIVAENNLD